MFLIAFIVYGLTFLVLPLIPVTMLCLTVVIMVGDAVKDVFVEGKGEFHQIKRFACMVRSNLSILSVYLLVAYGGMGRMIFFKESIGEISFWMLIFTWFLSLWILLLPILTPIYTVLFTSFTDTLEKQYEHIGDKEKEKKKNQQTSEGSLGFVVKMAVRAIFCPCFLKERLPLCKCGMEMQRMRVKEAYERGGVSCDRCHKTIDDKWEYIFHCPQDTYSAQHPSGYDFCRDCGINFSTSRTYTPVRLDTN